MSRTTYLLAVFLVLLIALAGVMVVSGSAQGSYPDGVEVYQIPSGQWCQLVNGVFAGCFCPCETEVINVCEPTPVPTYEPTITPTKEPTKKTPTPPPTKPTPTNTPEPQVYCHCEQGEGEGALDRKNCHVAKYNNGHANHMWDYFSTDGTCQGWNH